MTEPLSETPPSLSDLSTLYTLDPLSLTRDDPRVHAMVLGLRAQRANFVLSESKGERPKTERKAKAPVKPVSLDNLDLDI